MRTQANFTLLRHLAVLTALLAAAGCGDDMRVADVDLGPPDPVDMATPDMEESMCEPGFVDCGDGCSRLAGDTSNCGSCGNTCPTGFSCAVGRCDCEEPMKGCDGYCIDPQTDPSNCGDCGTVCGDGDVCIDGECVIECDPSQSRCSGGDGEFVCADLSTDSENCGVCGAGCSVGATCVDGACACADGEISCNGTCIDPMTDAARCGNCLTSCGEGGVCMDGSCSTCGAGLEACGSPARCTDTQTSRLHCGACGNTCAAGEGCNDGVCECLPGFVDCDGECAVLATDRDHCGACGVDCGALGECSAGVCVCAPEATECGAECAVLETSASHCGACDNACAAGELCRDSSCILLNATCPTATVITTDTMIVGEDIDDGGARPQGTGCGTSSGDNALYYAVTVPANSFVNVTTDGTFDRVLLVQDACDATACTFRTDSSPERAFIDNPTASPITRIVAVHNYSSSGSGTFDISFEYDTAPTNVSCAAATPITVDTAITGQPITYGGARPQGTACGTSSGDNALYYEVTIPANSFVNITTAGTFDRVLLVQDACGATECTFRTDTSPERAFLENATASPVTQIVAIHNYSSSGSGTFDITFDFGTPPTNDSCAAATAITGDTSITSQPITYGGARPQGTDCGTSSGDNALYYEVTIPAGEMVSVTTAGTFDRVLLVQDACGATECTFRTDSSPERALLQNPTGSPVTRVVAIHNYSSTGSGTFDIDFAYRAIPTNTTCATATTITADTTISTEPFTAGGPAPTGSGCGFGTGATALFYEVVVPAGQVVDAVATSPSDLVLFVQDACADTTCTDYSDFPEEVTVDNSAGATERTFYVGVRGYSSSTSGTYEMAFTYTTP